MNILFLIASYLLGSLPSGYVLFWISEKKDIRNFGSGSTGATNLFRLKGWKLALPALFIDVLKGVLPAYLAIRVLSDIQLAALSALLAVIGHCFPVYLKFRGGKGVATMMGAFAVLAFKPFLISLTIWLLVIGISRYVSLGSLLAAFSYPFLTLIFHNEEEIIYVSIALFLIVAIRHLGNINRLIKGEERKLGERKG
jgi:glycerol-3-phosphate acyltransferase PlsY